MVASWWESNSATLHYATPFNYTHLSFVFVFVFSVEPQQTTTIWVDDRRWMAPNEYQIDCDSHRMLSLKTSHSALSILVDTNRWLSKNGTYWNGYACMWPGKADAGANSNIWMILWPARTINKSSGTLEKLVKSTIGIMIDFAIGLLQKTLFASLFIARWSSNWVIQTNSSNWILPNWFSFFFVVLQLPLFWQRLQLFNTRQDLCAPMER